MVQRLEVEVGVQHSREDSGRKCCIKKLRRDPLRQCASSRMSIDA